MKIKKIIIPLIIVMIAEILLFIFLITKINNEVIFINSHENYAWAPVSYGYKIYANGKIEKYDNYNDEEELKKAKISKEELIQLKQLANLVEYSYTKNLNPESILKPGSLMGNFETFFDAGVTTKKVYNNKKGE